MHFVKLALRIARLLALWALPVLSHAAAQDIPLITYYDYPPFLVDGNHRNLTDELADVLSKHSGGRYRFVPIFLPKGRLDARMAEPNWQGLVAWVHPRFVQDEAQTRYLWTVPLMHETDMVASNRAAPIDYTGPESLRGKVLGTIVNQRYADVEALIAVGQLRRDDAPLQENNLRKLMIGRVDAVFVSQSTLNWFRHRIDGFDSKVYLAAKPRNTFNRSVLVSRNLPADVAQYVRQTVAGLSRLPEWKAVMERYNILDQMP